MLRISRAFARPCAAPPSPSLTPVCARYRRYVPGMVIPNEFLTTRTEMRDVLYTVAFHMNRGWHWMKPYRQLLLAKHKIRYVEEMRKFMESEEWRSFMADDRAKALVEEQVKLAKKPW